MSMSAPFDPEQQGSAVPVDGSDGSDGSDASELEVEVEEGRAASPDADAWSDADASPERLHDEDEAGGGPVFRRPQPGERLHAEDLSEELSEDSELDS